MSILIMMVLIRARNVSERKFYKKKHNRSQLIDIPVEVGRGNSQPDDSR